MLLDKDQYPEFTIEKTTETGGIGSAGYGGNEFLIFEIKGNDSIPQNAQGERFRTYNNTDIIEYKWEDAAQVLDQQGNVQKLDVYL